MSESNEGLEVVESASSPMPVEQVLTQVKRIHSLMAEAMAEGVHYGRVPGTQKPTLLKPGAEKLCMMFRLVMECDVERKFTVNEDDGLEHFEVYVAARLIHQPSGVLVSQGVGFCSTKESKYRWRTSRPECPSCGAEAIIRSKPEYGEGWVCWKKKGGCGETFDSSHNFREIKIPNPDIADQYNTVLKMAKKRALIDATLVATAASDIFTQDVEDFADASEGAKNGPQRKKDAPPTQPPQETEKASDALDMAIQEVCSTMTMIELEAVWKKHREFQANPIFQSAKDAQKATIEDMATEMGEEY